MIFGLVALIGYAVGFGMIAYGLFFADRRK